MNLNRDRGSPRGNDFNPNRSHFTMKNFGVQNSFSQSSIEMGFTSQRGIKPDMNNLLRQGN